jgi:hypothetical protein
VARRFPARFTRAAPACHAFSHTAAPGVVGASLHRIEHLLQHSGAIALNTHVGRKSPHRKIGLQGIDVDLDPFDGAAALGILRNERHIRIQQQAEIGLFQQGQGIEAGEAGRGLRDIEVDRIEFRDPDAAAPRQPVQHGDGLRLAAKIGRQCDRVFRRHQCLRDRIDPHRLDAACVHAAIPRGRIGGHVGNVPLFGERFPRQHHVDRAGRIALCERTGAGQCLLHHDAGGERVFPFDIRPDDAGDVERVLHEMNVSVARSGQFAVQRVGCASGEQHDRQPVTKQILDRHAGVGGTGIDMHQNRLTASRRQGVAASHMDGDDLVRAQDHFGMLAAFPVPARQLLDQGDVIGAQIGKDVVHPEVDQAFEEMMRG